MNLKIITRLGNCQKVWNMLQYCISTYSQIFIRKKYGVHGLLFDAIFENISLVIALPFKLYFVNKIS